MKECVFCAINCVVLLLGIKNECAGRVDRCPQCLECAKRLQALAQIWLVEGPARKVVRRVREQQYEKYQELSQTAGVRLLGARLALSSASVRAFARQISAARRPGATKRSSAD